MVLELGAARHERFPAYSETRSKPKKRCANLHGDRLQPGAILSAEDEAKLGKYAEINHPEGDVR